MTDDEARARGEGVGSTDDGDADGDAVRGDGLGDDGARADHAMVADAGGVEHLDPGGYPAPLNLSQLPEEEGFL